MRQFVVFASMILIHSACALAGDFSSLPPEAQAGIKDALQRNVAIQHFTLTASDGQDGYSFGTSVAIDGNTVVVGNNEGNIGPGAAYVFVKPQSGWKNMTQTAELTSSDGKPSDGFGQSVAISGDTIAIGEPGATVNGNQDQGAAYVFVKPKGGWTNMTETAKLVASDGSASGLFGLSVSTNGNTVFAGAPEPSGVGSAYVFAEPIGGWTNMTQTAELTASDGTNSNGFGGGISASASTVVVSGGGAAYVFVEPVGGWVNTTQTAKLTSSDGAPLVRSVSLNGNTAVGGAPGAAYMFVEPSGGWVNMTQTAKLTDGKNDESFGQSVSISGNIVLVGDFGVDGDSGAAFIFTKPSGGWQSTSHYNAEVGISFPYGWDMFGSSVAISGTTGFIGAPNAPTTLPCNMRVQCTPGPGEAFIFTAQ